MKPNEINQIGRYVSILHRSSQIALNHLLDLPGLTASNANLLLFIFDNGKVTAQDIADQQAINKGLVSRELNSLLKNGYVEKSVDKQDKRNIQITLTARGVAAYQTVNNLMSKWWQQQFEASGLTDQTRLYADLQKLTTQIIGVPLQFHTVSNKNNVTKK